jgi:hypothetical protein
LCASCGIPLGGTGSDTGLQDAAADQTAGPGADAGSETVVAPPTSDASTAPDAEADTAASDVTPIPTSCTKGSDCPGSDDVCLQGFCAPCGGAGTGGLACSGDKHCDQSAAKCAD